MKYLHHRHTALTATFLIALALPTIGCTGGEEIEEVPELQVNVWDAARDRGVDFRAIGQEPGWLLEIHDDKRIHFEFDYARQAISAPAPRPITADSATVGYRTAAGADSLVVRIAQEPCTDTMSGEAFEASVTVEFGETTYSGCGRSLY